MFQLTVEIYRYLALFFLFQNSNIEKSGSTLTLSDGIKEGYLTCKVAILDGKKATDRSWKTVYAVLKAKALYMFKDKKMATENCEYEEKPVKLSESEVEVANDYTKRKNVFRVKTEYGSEYLFQVVVFSLSHWLFLSKIFSKFLIRDTSAILLVFSKWIFKYSELSINTKQFN